MRKTILVLALMFCGALSMAAPSRITASIYIAPVTGRGSRPDDNSWFYTQLEYELTNQRVAIANARRDADYSLIGTVGPYLPTGKFSFHLELQNNKTGAITVEGDLLYVTPYDTEPLFSSLVTSLIYTIPGFVDVTGVKLNKNKLYLEVGDSAILIATVEPDNATNKNVVWDSNKKSVATVEPGNATNKNVAFKSSNENIASVDENTGTVTAHEKGQATITVTTVDGGYNATCVVIVDKVIHVTGVKLDPRSLHLVVGDSAILTATVEPDNATNKNVEWDSNNKGVATVEPGNATNKNVAFKSSNENIASVDENTGTVTAVGVGSATITVTTVDGGYDATCIVTVTPVPVTPIYLSVGASLTYGIYAKGISQADFPVLNLPFSIQGGPSFEFHFLKGRMSLGTGLEIQLDGLKKGTDKPVYSLIMGMPLLIKYVFEFGSKSNFVLEPYVGPYFNIFHAGNITPALVSVSAGLQFNVKTGSNSNELFFDGGFTGDFLPMFNSKATNITEFNRYYFNLSFGYKFRLNNQRKTK